MAGAFTTNGMLYMLGTFLFGGSDIVMLFQKQVDFSMLIKPGTEEGTYEHVLMGEAYGQLSLRK